MVVIKTRKQNEKKKKPTKNKPLTTNVKREKKKPE